MGASERRGGFLRGGQGREAPATFLNPALLAKLQRAELVSFDVFDTLVTRPLLAPHAVFELVARRAAHLLDPYLSGPQAASAFRALRQQVAPEAMELARQRGWEEYDLEQVYRLLCRRIGAPDQLVNELKTLEEQVELALHAPREAGRQLFERGRALGKGVLLISDMYLERSVVESIVQRCGYRDYQALYVSSEHGLLKRSGRLYQLIREREAAPQRWLHIGDNPRSDLSAPKALGIATHPLPNVSELYLAQREPELSPRERLGNTLGSSLLHGVISRKFYDRPAPAQARYDGSAYRMGYEGGGPLLLAFTQWLIERARRDGVSDLYFLARDGHLPLQLWKRLTAGDAGAPRAHYLLASRRAFLLPALQRASDLAGSMPQAGRAQLGSLLRHRYGVQLSGAGAGEHGDFAGPEAWVDFNKPAQRKAFERVLLKHADAILSNAERERAVLLSYLAQMGLSEQGRRPAVVDIGHHASLQWALSSLLQRRDLGGYYFATFEPARAVYQQGLPVSSYLLEFEDVTRSEHAYSKSVRLFEFLFLPAIPSLEKLAQTASGAIEPVYVEGDESKRFALIEQVHRGVLDFVEDVLAASGGDHALFDVSKNEALRSFMLFASAPQPADARLLQDVSFVDLFAGAERSYLIAPSLLRPQKGAKLEDYRATSLWPEGAAAAQGRVRKAPPARRLPRAGWQRKVRKLLRDPKQFVVDMNMLRALRKKRR